MPVYEYEFKIGDKSLNAWLDIECRDGKAVVVVDAVVEGLVLRYVFEEKGVDCDGNTEQILSEVLDRLEHKLRVVGLIERIKGRLNSESLGC